MNYQIDNHTHYGLNITNMSFTKDVFKSDNKTGFFVGAKATKTAKVKPGSVKSSKSSAPKSSSSSGSARVSVRRQRH